MSRAPSFLIFHYFVARVLVKIDVVSIVVFSCSVRVLQNGDPHEVLQLTVRTLLFQFSHSHAFFRTVTENQSKNRGGTTSSNNTLLGPSLLTQILENRRQELGHSQGQCLSCRSRGGHSQERGTLGESQGSLPGLAHTCLCSPVLVRTCQDIFGTAATSNSKTQARRVLETIDR